MLAAHWHARRDVRVEEFQLGPVLVPTTPHPLSHRSAPLTLGVEDGFVPLTEDPTRHLKIIVEPQHT